MTRLRSCRQAASVGELKSRLLEAMPPRVEPSVMRTVRTLRLYKRRGARPGAVLRDGMRLKHCLSDVLGAEDKEVRPEQAAPTRGSCDVCLASAEAHG